MNQEALHPAPPEPEPRASLPAEIVASGTPRSEPPSPEPLYVLILERSSPLPVAETGRLVASHLGIHPTDATARVRYGGGLIAEDLKAEAADALAADLKAVGVFTRKIGADRWGIAPVGYHVSALEFLEDTLLARLPTESELVIPRDEIFGIDVYLIECVEGREEPEPEDWGTGRRTRAERRAAASPLSQGLPRPRRGGSSALEALLGGPLLSEETPLLSPRGQRLVEHMKKMGWSDRELRGTIYCAEPAGPLHVTKNRFDYSCLGGQKRKHSVDNFLTLFEELLRILPAAWNREVVERFLEDLDPTRIVRYKEEESANFQRWMLQWVRIEMEGRRDRGRGQ